MADLEKMPFKMRYSDGKNLLEYEGSSEGATKIWEMFVRSIATKQCSVCGEEKTLANFKKDSRRPYSAGASCLRCEKVKRGKTNG